MLAYFQTYKTYVLAGLLCAYLAGTFEVLFMEGMHGIVHIAGAFRTEIQHSYYNHVHEDGKAHTHRHIVLEKIDEALDESSNPKNIPAKDQPNSLKKKNPEQRSTFDPIVNMIILFPEIPQHPVSRLLQTFTKVPTPPPRSLG